MFIIRHILPILNVIVNGLVLYRLGDLLLSYFEFEYLVLFIYFMLFCMVGIHGVFHNILSFMDIKGTFNLMFIVQFFTSVLIMQLLGWLFTLYLAFVFMLIYLIIKKEKRIYDHVLHLCGISIGGSFLLMMI